MASKVLIIDDDERLNQLLHDYLGKMGYGVASFTDPEIGISQITQEQPHLIILDVMLPKMSGFEVCRKIRDQHNIPIVMLTARGELSDRVIGLEMGADDYLSKPFDPRELVARIQAILRRTQERLIVPYKRYGDLSLDLQKYQATLNGKVLNLTTKEFACLALLSKNRGKVLSRDTILEELRGVEWDALNRSVDITMSRLRQKLKDNPKDPKFIKTIWGSGYVFIEKESRSA